MLERNVVEIKKSKSYDKYHMTIKTYNDRNNYVDLNEAIIRRYSDIV